MWRGVVDNGFTADGRRKQAYLQAKTREECVRKLRQLLREIASEDISRKSTHQLEAEARTGIAHLDAYLRE